MKNHLLKHAMLISSVAFGLMTAWCWGRNPSRDFSLDADETPRDSLPPVILGNSHKKYTSQK